MSSNQFPNPLIRKERELIDGHRCDKCAGGIKDTLYQLLVMRKEEYISQQSSHSLDGLYQLNGVGGCLIKQIHPFDWSRNILSGLTELSCKGRSIGHVAI